MLPHFFALVVSFLSWEFLYEQHLNAAAGTQSRVAQRRRHLAATRGTTSSRRAVICSEGGAAEHIVVWPQLSPHTPPVCLPACLSVRTPQTVSSDPAHRQDSRPWAPRFPDSLHSHPERVCSWNLCDLSIQSGGRGEGCRALQQTCGARCSSLWLVSLVMLPSVYFIQPCSQL